MKQYNGWTNWETWETNLHLTNTQYYYNRAKHWARKSNFQMLRDLADHIIPDEEKINFDKVNWAEIAEGLKE
jgi:uncharacterized protein YcaQ|tara:strand:+ start:69 stop:284 length:216 start_codon:yes stop_codon:yes gene_type:complete